MNEKPVILVPLESLTLGIILAFCATFGDDIMRKWFSEIHMWGIRPTIYLGFMTLPILMFGKAPKLLELLRKPWHHWFIHFMRWSLIGIWILNFITYIALPMYTMIMVYLIRGF